MAAQFDESEQSSRDSRHIDLPTIEEATRKSPPAGEPGSATISRVLTDQGFVCVRSGAPEVTEVEVAWRRKEVEKAERDRRYRRQERFHTVLAFGFGVPVFLIVMAFLEWLF